MAVTSREAGTQTPPDDQATSHLPPTESTTSHSYLLEQPPAHTLTPPILETLSLAKADIVCLQRDRDAVKEELAKEIKKHDEFKKESEVSLSLPDYLCIITITLQSLQLECGVLRDALSEFSRWVRGKLGRMEENMDIFHVIYSLHGSLSQVGCLIRSIHFISCHGDLYRNNLFCKIFRADCTRWSRRCYN